MQATLSRPLLRAGRHRRPACTGPAAVRGGPLQRQYLRLLRRKKALIVHGAAYASLEQGLRSLASLPHRKLQEAAAAKVIVASSVAIHLALGTIWSEGFEVLRRSISNTHGPVGRFHSPSGLAALVDYGECLLHSIEQLCAGITPDAPKSQHHQRDALPSVAGVHVHLDSIVAWLMGFFAGHDLDGLGSFALQDLTRQLPVLPTSQEKKLFKRRTSALTRVFPRESLDGKAKEVLLILEQASRASPPVQPTQQMLVLELEGKFKRRKLATVTADLGVLGYIAQGEAAKGKEPGFVITFAGTALLRFHLRPSR